jgi:iron complex outermembrane receptor protein
MSSYFLHAQKTLTGTIKDAKTGQPLVGVSVKLKSGKGGVVTNNSGAFKIQVSPGDELQITMVSYNPQSVVIADQSDLVVNLEPGSSELTEIVFVGTRGAGRAKTETPVPVDVIKVNQVGLPTARMDLTSVLNYSAPSFNYNKQSGADGADHIDIATLRGLAADHTLVLVNGKRYHKTAFVGLFGTRGKGNSGTDLNSLPEESIDRVEILRDGASAQYGSDAIAGVMNIILKKNIGHLSFNAGYAVYDDDQFNAYKTRATNSYYYSHPLDGSTFATSLDYGIAAGKKGGFINFAANFLTQAKTFRQVADTNVSTNAKALPDNYARRAFGDGSLTEGGIMINTEIPLGNGGNTTLYAFGGANYKASDAYAYSRNDDPSRSPIDASGNLIYVPSIMHTTKDGLIYYNPHIQTHITDGSFAVGVRGEAGKGWHWDLSNSFGYNNFHYFGDKTFNASIVGATKPNHFDDGGFYYLENTLNLDFNKSFPQIAAGTNLGLGAEYRYEQYVIYKGEEASWKEYPNTFGQAPGSQGFPGFRPQDEANANRSNVGGYADAELNITKKWLIDGAIRLENYTDFGFTSNYKLATRYKITDNFNIRGSISTGFRAPSLPQINFSNTLTTFVGPNLEEEHIAANGSAITKSAGIPALKQEKSVNASIGFSWRPASGLTITVDGYLIKVKDRIVLSGLFSSQDNTLPPEFLDTLQSLNVALAQFFANAVNTTNTGIDIVFDYNKKWSNKGLHVLLAGNLQNMTIDNINVPSKLNDSYLHRKTFFSDREESFLLASAPKAKVSLNLDYTINKFGVGAHFTYFGKVTLLGFGYTGYDSLSGTGGPGDPAISGSFAGIDPYVPIDNDPNPNHVLPERFVYGGKVTTDLYGSYNFSKTMTLFLGVDNVFNVHPDYGAVQQARYVAYDNESGGPWDSVQMGYNGRRFFAKLAFNF